MRNILWTLAAVVLLVHQHATAAQPDAPANAAFGGDEQTLQSAGLTTDGPSLLDFFRRRARPEADSQQLQSLVQKLGDESPTIRERSAAELVAWGPVAIPLLRHAVNDLADLDAAERARKCLQSIEGPTSATLPAAAARLMAVRKPTGAAEALLAYLPFADNPVVLHEVSAALSAVAYADGKPERAVVRALKDSVPLRRAVAGTALCRADQPDQRAAVRQLLQDPKPLVRLRAALALANVQDAEAIPVLIDLLADLPLEQRKEAEEVLTQLAGEWAPGSISGEDEIARRIRRDAWAAWWRNTDGPALLAVLRKRTLTPDNQKKVQALIKTLGDEAFDARERAQADLVSMGTLTLPLLREAAKDKDLEVARRAKESIQLIEKDPANVLPTAVFRLLVMRRPAGAAETLLAYLPHAENETLAAEAQTALNALAIRDGKPEPVLVAALEDKLPWRRAAAGEALSHAGADQRPAVRKLLKDTDPVVRRRVAVALVTAHDKEAVPAMIDLLADLPLEEAWQVQDILAVLADDKAPEMVAETDAASRKKNRDAWAAWWKEHGDKADFTKLDGGQRFLGYTLLIEGASNRIVELGADHKPRWQIGNLQFPVDAVVLPGNRVLIAEYNGRKVTERDFTGKVLWEKTGLRGQPVNVQRLPNGNTFIATDTELIEVDRTGKEVYTINNIQGPLAAYKGRDGHIWCTPQNGRCVCLDTTGKELKSFPSNRGNAWTSGIDLLPSGGVLITQPDRNQVVEMDADGKVLKEFPAQQVTTATRLPNGNILAASVNDKRVFEIDRKGKVVWEYKDNNFDQFRARRR